jgi:hypothetical protein
VLLGAFAFGYGHVHRSNTANLVAGVAQAPRADVIPIRWREGDLAPASQAGRVCVTDTAHGQICASYVVGERPADTLTRQVEAMGLRVESVGTG